GTRRADGQWQARAAEPLQRAHAEVATERLAAAEAVELGRVQSGRVAGQLERRPLAGVETLGRPDAVELGCQSGGTLRAVKLGHGELAGRHVDVGQADYVFRRIDRREA